MTRLALYDAWVYEEQLPTRSSGRAPRASARCSSRSSTTERPDEQIALAFYDKRKYVTERLVEEVERALDRPGTVAAALAAVRGAALRRGAEAVPHHRSSRRCSSGAARTW